MEVSPLGDNQTLHPARSGPFKHNFCFKPHIWVPKTPDAWPSPTPIHYTEWPIVRPVPTTRGADEKFAESRELYLGINQLECIWFITFSSPKSRKFKSVHISIQ